MSKLNFTVAAGLFQVCYVVRDIRAAAAFFHEHLGVRRFMRFDNLEPKDRTYMGRPSDFKLHMYLGIAGDGPLIDPLGPSIIELIQPVFGDSIYQDFLDRGHEGLLHVGFAVKHYDEAVEAMTRQGRRMIQSAALGELRFCYFDGGPLGGSVTELVEAGPALTNLLQQLVNGNF
jgi:catechol 2,3-dioxygenase-like lactoylglutathione lyase family enzyme